MGCMWPGRASPRGNRHLDLKAEQFPWLGTRWTGVLSYYAWSVLHTCGLLTTMVLPPTTHVSPVEGCRLARCLQTKKW